MIVFCLNNNKIQAQNNASISLDVLKEDFIINENFEIVPYFKFTENTNVSVFRMKIKFNPEIITFQNISRNANINSSEIKINNKIGEIIVIYLTDSKGLEIVKNDLFYFLKLNFKAKNLGETAITAEIDGLHSFNETSVPVFKINNINIHVKKPEEKIYDCSLKMLIPIDTENDLKPDFSPEILNYTLQVPYDKKEIEFSAEANDPTCTVTINRKTLQKAGTPTSVTVTVTSADKKAKKIYEVTVNRELQKIPEDITETPNSNSENTENTEDIKNTKNADSNTNSTNSPSASSSLVDKKIPVIKNSTGKKSSTSTDPTPVSSPDIAPTSSSNTTSGSDTTTGTVTNTIPSIPNYETESIINNFQEDPEEEMAVLTSSSVDNPENLKNKNSQSTLIVKENNFSILIFCTVNIIILIIIFFIFKFKTKN